jgi:hypothetical protein
LTEIRYQAGAVAAKLGEIASALRNKIVRKATEKATAPMIKGVKKNITPNNRSGLLRKAVVKKVRTYASGVSVGLIGVSSDFRGTFRGRNAWPDNYVHLVEDGTTEHEQPKRGVTHPGSRAFEPFARAQEQTKAQAEQAFVQTTIDELGKLT